MVDVAYLYATILVNSEHLESAGTFNTKHLGHIICIFKDNSDYQFCLGKFISTSRLWILSRNQVCVTWML